MPLLSPLTVRDSNPRFLPTVFRFRLAAIALLSLLVVGCSSVKYQLLNQMTLTELKVKGDQLYLMGTLNRQSLKQVRQALQQNPQVNTLVFTISSGSIDDETTFELGRYIRSRGLNTHLLSNSMIASGAVDLFLAGKQRSIEQGARLGVHAWSDHFSQASDYPQSDPEHRLNADYIADMLGHEKFYWFTIQAADADNIYWMSDAELDRFQLATQPLMPPSYELTPFGQRFLVERQKLAI